MAPFEPMERPRDPASVQQAEQAAPDDSDTQWLAEYNERLLLTVRAIHQLVTALTSRLP